MPWIGYECGVPAPKLCRFVASIATEDSLNLDAQVAGLPFGAPTASSSPGLVMHQAGCVPDLRFASANDAVAVDHCGTSSAAYLIPRQPGLIAVLRQL